MSPLSPRLDSVAGLLADAYAPEKPVSRWYCPNRYCDGKPHDHWDWKHCRSAQRPPDNDWFIWLLLSGRGFGKSRTAAEWIVDQVQEAPKTEWGVIGPTSESVRKCAEDLTAGIMNILPAHMAPPATKYNRTLGDIYFPNGAVIHLISADKPDRLRGFNLAGAWCDEIASWRYPDAWYLGLLPALRIGNPRVVITSTPKPVQLLRNLVEEENSERGTTIITRGSTFDNSDNLPSSFLDEMRTRYEGTRRGRQELYGELLTDVDGALVSQDMIDGPRLRDRPEHIRFTRIVVAVDPATTSGEDSDETGIVVCAKGADNRGYVLDDLSCKESPDGWARIVVAAYEKYRADRVVLEKNQGGDAWETIIRSVHPNISFKAISAKSGKKLRAEPVAALYEQGKVSHVGYFPQLEDQWTTWVPDMKGQKSPDRVDALVHGLTELGLVGLKTAHIKEWLEDEHPPCLNCGTPAPKGTPRCPSCGMQLNEGAEEPQNIAAPWNRSGWSAPPLMPDPTTKAVMDMLRREKLGVFSRFGQYGR